MKTNLLTLALFGLLVQIPTFAQDVTTVNATSNEISDNLDLRAVASIFGTSKNLEDFERQLNDPQNKISNLDLNFDRQVDYLRVIEAVEKNTHLIILQAVLERDVFQDVATIEVERGRNNQVQVQVVGDVFMYGQNYIYEPVYVVRPLIYNNFWVNNYNPYFSPYYFNYYPTYFYGWSPYPVYRYQRNVYVHINHNNYYNYCTTRRSNRAAAMYETRRTNAYERRNPNQSFSARNSANNRYELERSRISDRQSTNGATRNNTANAGSNVRTQQTPSSARRVNSVRSENTNATIRTRTSSNNVQNTPNQTAIISNSTPQRPVRSNGIRNTSNPSSTTRNYSQQQNVRKVEQSIRVSRNNVPSNSTSSSRNSRENNTSTRTKANNRS